MQRIIGPALFLAVLALIAVRTASDPARDLERARISATWNLEHEDPAARSAQIAQVDRFLADHVDDAASRWFGARAYLKLALLPKAVKTVFDHGAVDTETAARFGQLLLRHWGYLDDENLMGPRTTMQVCLLLLAEGGDRLAERRIDELIVQQTPAGFLRLYYGTLFLSTLEIRQHVAGLLREREDADSRIAAAMAMLGRDEYDHRQKDLDRLRSLLRGPAREAQRTVWALACLALGRSGDPVVLGEMSLQADALARSPQESDRMDAALLSVGLVAAGDPTAAAVAEPYVTGPQADSLVRLWYVGALLERVRRGEAWAVEKLMAVWDHVGRTQDARVRRRIAVDLLLRDDEPGPHVPTDRILADLEDREAGPGERTIAAAWRYRQGEAGSRADLLARLREAEARQRPFLEDPEMLDPLVASPRLIAARALWLYRGQDGTQ